MSSRVATTCLTRHPVWNSRSWTSENSKGSAIATVSTFFSTAIATHVWVSASLFGMRRSASAMGGCSLRSANGSPSWCARTSAIWRSVARFIRISTEPEALARPAVLRERLSEIGFAHDPRLAETFADHRPHWRPQRVIDSCPDSRQQPVPMRQAHYYHRRGAISRPHSSAHAKACALRVLDVTSAHANRLRQGYGGPPKLHAKAEACALWKAS